MEHPTYPLENLLPPNILQPPIQIPHLLHNIIHLALIRPLNRARLPNHQIQSKLDPRLRLSTTKPSAARRGVVRGEADFVFAAVGGSESEAAFGGAFLVDDAVVVIENFVDGNLDG